MENKNLFSIVMPVYNRENLIEESLVSLKKQSYRPIQLIIVDDGSNDNTKETVKRWSDINGERNNFIIEYFYQKNAGPSAARNKGLAHVKGKYIQFFDSDDIMHEDRLAILIKTFEKTGADFIQTGFDAFDHETKDVVMKNLGKPNANQYELALEGRFWANTIRASISKTLAENIGPWKTDMICFEDREYMERAVSNAKKPVAIKDVLASARRGGSQRVSQKLRSYEGRKLRIYCEKQLLSYLSLHPNVNKKVLRKFANRILTLGVRSNTNGWNDLAMECVEIYRLTNTKLTMKDLVKTQMIRYGKVLPKINAWLVFKVLRLKK